MNKNVIKPLLGLCIAKGMLFSAYAHVDQDLLKQEDKALQEKPLAAASHKDDADQEKALPLIQLHSGKMKIGNFSGVIRDKKEGLTWDLEHSIKASLAIEAELPELLNRRDGKVKLAITLDRKSVKFSEAAMVVGPFTGGYRSTIFAYSKTNPLLPIAVDASVLQMKMEHTWGCFRLGYALESAKELKLGLFDKNAKDEDENEKKPAINNNQSGPAATEPADQNKADQNKQDGVNKVDDPKKKPAFKPSGKIAAVGASLAVVGDFVDIGLSGLMRCTYYTHAKDPKRTVETDGYHCTYGVNVGFACKTAAKDEKINFTGQFTYLYGLGDYIAGLSAIQEDEERKEMCAVYYTDKDRSKLYNIAAIAGGATLKWAVTTKWAFSAAASYLRLLENRHRPASACHSIWKIIPILSSYTFSKHWTLESGYDISQEQKQEKAKDKPVEHRFFGSIKLEF